MSYDRGRKARLYAERGVPEYWIVNLVDNVVEVHSEPVDGVYQQLRMHPSDTRIRLLEFPEVELSVDDFLS